MINQISKVDVIRNPVPLQPASLDIWALKYQLKSFGGEEVDKSINDTYKRVAKALASVEMPSQRTKYEELFYQAMVAGAIPGGRIISNAGAEKFKPATSTINCTVSSTINDSMDDILAKVHEAGLTLKSGCGIGYEFSTLRPKNSFVSGAGAYTSGPLSFMDIYDKMCFTVSSAGGRRGAQMATFDVQHPDVEDFISAKREDGRLRQFNLSLLITDDFIEAVKSDRTWPLSFPIHKSDLARNSYNLDDTSKVLWRRWPTTESYITNNKGEVACLIHKFVSAKSLWDKVMRSTYNFSDPGFILIDEVNDMNNNWFCENIRATNPCGELPLPPNGSCLLGSINLTGFVEYPFTAEARFNFEKFREVVAIFTRMLDNVVEINGLPLDLQRKEILYKRRHGMGYLGLGSALTMLGVIYGSSESVKLTEDITREMALTGWRQALALAKEKGAAPIMDDDFTVTESVLHARPEMREDGFKLGDTVKGRLLHSKYSRYMRKIARVDPNLVEQLIEYGARFTHHSSIAPTGTIALSLANNASNGIEPSFAHSYGRNVIREGRKTKEQIKVFSYELLAYRHFVNKNADINANDKDNGLPDCFISADTVLPAAHIDVQAAAQIWVDSSISKTVNVATEIDYDDFKDIYMYAHKKGLKGCTTFRFNPDAHQGVLVKDEDLRNTWYQFKTEGGEPFELRGDESVEYLGELTTAANLYESLKEKSIVV